MKKSKGPVASCKIILHQVINTFLSTLPQRIMLRIAHLRHKKIAYTLSSNTQPTINMPDFKGVDLSNKTAVVTGSSRLAFLPATIFSSFALNSGHKLTTHTTARTEELDVPLLFSSQKEVPMLSSITTARVAQSEPRQLPKKLKL